jgi:hypothetical protein
MWLADLLRRFVLFYLKFIFAMSALVLFLGYLQAAWHSVHLPVPNALALPVFFAALSVSAYLVREHRKGKDRLAAAVSTRGAERTPVLPHAGGEPC